MKLPKIIKIGPILYRIKTRKGLRSSDGAELFGQIFTSDCKILINKKYVNSQWLPFAIWHEVLHGIFAAAGIHDEDEKIVEILSYGIVDALRKNKALREE